MSVAADTSCAGTMELVERSITIGDGTDYAWDGTISGLGEPEVRNYDVDKGHGDGATSQHDFLQTRTIIMPVSIAPAPGESLTRAQVWQRWITLRTAWAKSFTTDLTLLHTEAGFTDTYIGRPSGAALDDTMWRKGMNVLRVALTFRCPDPTRY